MPKTLFILENCTLSTFRPSRGLHRCVRNTAWKPRQGRGELRSSLIKLRNTYFGQSKVFIEVSARITYKFEVSRFSDELFDHKDLCVNIFHIFNRERWSSSFSPVSGYISLQQLYKLIRTCTRFVFQPALKWLTSIVNFVQAASPRPRSARRFSGKAAKRPLQLTLLAAFDSVTLYKLSRLHLENLTLFAKVCWRGRRK